MENIYIQHWDEEKFLHSRNEWNELLRNSNSDQLFLSWEWQYSWWKIFSEPENMSLEIYVATNGDGKLLGIAPLYSTMVTTRRFFRSRRLQFIGNCWRGKSTMLTELLDLVVDKSKPSDIIRALITHINSLNHWDEFVAPFLDTGSETFKQLNNQEILPGCYIRLAEEYNSYYLNLKSSFIDFSAGLGKNTRLKLLNRRSLFDSLGKTKFERMQGINIDENFELLNQLHSERWGKPIFDGKRLDFNTTVAHLLAERNCVNFSVLSLDDVPVSIQYNYVIDHHNYNIQAGFNESFHKKISLGYLHFGNEIEASYNEHDLVYDFLAGEGKNTQYKERLTDTYLSMADLQIIRSPALKLLYRSFGLLKSFKNHLYR